MQFRDPKPGRFEIINFDVRLNDSGFSRGVVAVFDVKLLQAGAALCNLTLESNRDGELVLGYSRSSIRKRAPKGRRELRLGLTPEFEMEIFTAANYELPIALRKERKREERERRDKHKQGTSLTLPAEGEVDLEVDPNE